MAFHGGKMGGMPKMHEEKVRGEKAPKAMKAPKNPMKLGSSATKLAGYGKPPR